MSEAVPLIMTQSCPQGSQIMDEKIQGVWDASIPVWVPKLKAKLKQN